jgi:hypothetical protein
MRPMRRMFTTREALARGMTEAELRWGVRTGRWSRVRHGVLIDGPEPPTALERRAADVLASDGVGSGHLAAVLHGFDGVALDGHPIRRRDLPTDRLTVVQGIRCTDALQTLVDIAPTVTDAVLEQALEYALRRRLVSVASVEERPATGRGPVSQL